MKGCRFHPLSLIPESTFEPIHSAFAGENYVAKLAANGPEAAARSLRLAAQTCV